MGESTRRRHNSNRFYSKAIRFFFLAGKTTINQNFRACLHATMITTRNYDLYSEGSCVADISLISLYVLNWPLHKGISLDIV